MSISADPILVSTGVYTDVDGRPRPVGLPDLGAHEWGWRTYLPLILKQYSTQ